MVIANYLATGLVDPVFAAPTSYGGPDLLLATYGYAVQIYCDFSAYSDMAIGLAALLGFRFPANFNQPYRAAAAARILAALAHLAVDLAARLSLQAARRQPARPPQDLPQPDADDAARRASGMAPAWKFVVWGALHGGGLAVERMLEPGSGARARARPAQVVATLVVFHFVCLAWIFFRAEDFEVARLFIAGLGAGWSGGLQQAGPLMVALIAIGLAGQFTPHALFERIAAAFGRMPVWGLGAAAGIVVAAINALGPEGVAPFIYFRF